jgi:hypothetical protein
MGLVNTFVRAIYLATVVCATLLALSIATGLLYLISGAERPAISLLKDVASAAAMLALYVYPGIRALRRRWAMGTVILVDLVRERPIVAGLVTLAGGFGHLCFAILLTATIDIALAPEWPDDIGGPFALFFFSTLFWYVIALLCGEFVLVGSGESDAARASRSASL